MGKKKKKKKKNNQNRSNQQQRNKQLSVVAAPPAGSANVPEPVVKDTEKTNTKQEPRTTDAPSKKKYDWSKNSENNDNANSVEALEEELSEISLFDDETPDLSAKRKKTEPESEGNDHKQKDKFLKQGMERTQFAAILLFFIMMTAGTVIGFLYFLRPTVSMAENRTLTKLPELTAKSVLNGSYFSDLSLWYADTYPARDAMILADQAVSKLYGLPQSEQLIGSGAVVEEIPDVDMMDDTQMEDILAAELAKDELEEANNQEEAEASSQEIEASKDPAKTEEVKESDSGKKEEKDCTKKEKMPDSKELEKEIEKRIHEGLYVRGDAAYNLYYFANEPALIYTRALRRAAKELEGQTEVYSILIPENSGILLSDLELEKLGGSDQEQGIKYYYSLMPGIHTIETFQTLKEHKDEYLYFRTDHHWTARGAYYIYQNFCKEKGFEPAELSSFEKKTYKNFLGSAYSTLRSSKMKANPDYVEAFVPKSTNSSRIYGTDGSSYEWFVIADASKSDPGTKYSAFIGGDQPLIVINNPKTKSKESCLVLKESYGNCFVPFLVDHYKKVYVVDYRYTNLKVVSFIKEKGIDDLIVMNDLSIAGSTMVAKNIDSTLK